MGTAPDRRILISSRLPDEGRAKLVEVSETTNPVQSAPCVVTVGLMSPERSQAQPLRRDRGFAAGDGQIRAAIARAAVAAMKRCAGKGPTKASAYLLEDGVLIVMSDCLTRQERLLVANGHGDLVHQVRECLHELVGQEVSVDVAALTGRRVATVESLVSLDRDAEMELITLDVASRSGRCRMPTAETGCPCRGSER